MIILHIDCTTPVNPLGSGARTAAVIAAGPECLIFFRPDIGEMNKIISELSCNFLWEINRRRQEVAGVRRAGTDSELRRVAARNTERARAAHKNSYHPLLF